MGYGDEIIGTGVARAARLALPRPANWKVGFGDGRKILWGPWCEEMFAGNPYIARPGAEHTVSHWVPHYKGSRLYNKQSPDRTKWLWNYNFKVTPGEFFFNDAENAIRRTTEQTLGEFVVIEPNLPWQKSVWPNKDWGEEKYWLLAKRLHMAGTRVVQFIHKNTKRRLPDVTTLEFGKFRDSIAALSAAKLYIGPEGGMHHAAAAVGVGAVVLMGGFIPPSVVGYDTHTNLTGGAEACGSIHPCAHCAKAMERISVDEVFSRAAVRILA